jgi:hypothetical protein
MAPRLARITAGPQDPARLSSPAPGEDAPSNLPDSLMSSSRLSSFFTLRRTLTAAILLLGLALTASLGTLAVRAKLELDAVRLQGEEMMGAVRFGTGLAALLTERQVTVSALLGEAPADAAQRAQI